MKKTKFLLAAAIVTTHSFGVPPIFQKLMIKLSGNVFPIQYTSVDNTGVLVLKFENQVIYKKALKGLDTRKAIFQNCIFIESDLDDQDLTNAKFYQSSLRGPKNSFKGAILKGSKFSGSDLSEANLKRGDLEGVTITDEYIEYENPSETLNFDFSIGDNINTIDRYHHIPTNLTKADLTDANLTKANINGANFTSALLIGIKLNKSKITKSNFIKATMTYADMNQSTIQDCIIQQAQLSYASFNNTKIERSNIDLNGLLKSDFSKACIKDSSFRGNLFIEPKLFGTIFDNVMIIDKNIKSMIHSFELSTPIKKDGSNTKRDVLFFKWTEINPKHFLWSKEYHEIFLVLPNEKMFVNTIYPVSSITIKSNKNQKIFLTATMKEQNSLHLSDN